MTPRGGHLRIFTSQGLLTRRRRDKVDFPKENEFRRYSFHRRRCGRAEEVTKAFSDKYPVVMTTEEVEAGELWLFELAPRNGTAAGPST